MRWVQNPPTYSISTSSPVTLRAMCVAIFPKSSLPPGRSSKRINDRLYDKSPSLLLPLFFGRTLAANQPPYWISRMGRISYSSRKLLCILAVHTRNFLVQGKDSLVVMFKRKLAFDSRSGHSAHGLRLGRVAVAPQDRVRQGIHAASRNRPALSSVRHAIGCPCSICR